MQEIFEKIKERLKEHNRKLKTMKNQFIALSDIEVCDIENYAYNTAIEIVNQVAEEYVPDINVGENEEYCEWRLCDEEANVYDTACGNSEMLFDGSPIDNNYSFCPYCGKKIKLLECTNCKWYWQNNDTENTCSGSATTCIEYLEVAPYQPKGGLLSRFSTS